MAEPGGESAARDERVNQVLAEYLAAAEAGRAGERAAWLARYPDVAAELQAFFADEERLGQAAAALPSGARPAAPVGAPTLDAAAGATDPTLGAVRYFGDYELLEELARCGMAVGYKAR